MLDRLRRRRTLASFDYQWRHLPTGDAMLSDPWFVENVDRILAEELLGVERSWFPGRTVLDAGCGGGRWAVGLLRLGCRVLAVDASPSALDLTRRHAERFVPEAVAEERLETAVVDLLALPPSVSERRFDLIFSFGVLHHTGDTHRALAGLAPLVAPEGLLFLYLYGAGSATLISRVALGVGRAALAPLPFVLKKAVLARIFPGRDLHQAFDLWSPLVNDQLDHGIVEGWLRELGFPDVVRTLRHSELFLRASRGTHAAPVRPPPAPPYWFERYRRRR